MAVFNKNLLGFPDIYLDFVTSARETRHLTPKKSLGRGNLIKERATSAHGGEFDQKNKKCQMPGGQPGRGGRMDTLGSDSYITNLNLRHTHRQKLRQDSRRR